MFDLKKWFVLRKEKIYILFEEVREEVREFIQKRIRKKYIELSNLPQTALAFFVKKKR